MRDVAAELERASRQRDFYLKVLPQGGQQLAHIQGGFPVPGIDSQELETVKNFTQWMKFLQSPVIHYAKDAAWWMSQLMDQHHRLGREEQAAQADHMTAYALAVIGQLLDKNVLTWVNEPETMEIRVENSEQPPPLNPVEQANLDRLDTPSDWDDADWSDWNWHE